MYFFFFICVFLPVVLTIAYYCNLFSMKVNLAGKTALITGAASGIGRELALQLSRKGVRVLILDVQEDLMRQIGRTIEEEGGSVSCFLCDVSDSLMVKDTVRDIFANHTNVENCVFTAGTRKFGDVYNIDILINNAGIVFGKSLLDLEDDEIQRTIDVNLMSNFWTTRSVLPNMIKHSSGHIVTISSVAGTIGMNSLTDYCVSKFGSYGFGECLRRELYFHKDVHTTLVCPWIINTGMFYGAKEILLPSLDAVYVASAITTAIEYRTKVLMIPSIFHFAAVIRLLPPALVDWLGYIVGAMKATEGLIGRGKAWNMMSCSPNSKS